VTPAYALSIRSVVLWPFIFKPLLATVMLLVGAFPVESKTWISAPTAGDEGKVKVIAPAEVVTK
jgi:hypothetical protein